MDFMFIPSTKDDCKDLMNQYMNTVNGVMDDFWEAHIIGDQAQMYRIELQQDVIGFFIIFNNEKITLFYLMDQYLNLAQTMFQLIRDQFMIKTAYVSTADQMFLSLCLDNHNKIEMQAYFFDGTIKGEVRRPEYERDTIEEIWPEELHEVKSMTGDFFDFVTEDQLKNGVSMLYKLSVQSEVLGYGIIVPNQLLKKYWAVGMIVLENKRCKGVGRSIQIHLADICREHGYTPISGCWYYNHLSKKTIESAGRYTKTRLLNVIF